MSSTHNKELLNRGVEEIIEKKSLEKKINSGKKLRVKHGVDPTTPDLHIGHAVNYLKLKEFQDQGHKVVLIIGDFTASFGDPSDRAKARELRSLKEVRKMGDKYLDQIGKILDLGKTEIRYNSEWYEKMSARDLLNLMSNFTVARMLERDMFQKRITNSQEIALQEPVYPVLQGYDSVMIKSDLTVCGNDQKFNELQGRILQKIYNQVPQDVMTVPLLLGLDGKNKMSQSLGNYIGIDENPRVMYGKVMSIPDEIIPHYFELAARFSEKELKKIKEKSEDPNKRRDLKAQLARSIVSIYNGLESAMVAEEEFNRVFRDKEYPMDMPEIKIKNPRCEDLPQMLVDLKLASSKSDARRLIEQGGVKVDRAVISDYKASVCFHDKMVLQVGKFKFVKIRL